MKIETERLLIRPWRVEDVDHYQALSTDIGYNCFAPPGIFLVKDKDAAATKVKNRIDYFDEHQLGKFPLFETETGAFVGTCGGELFNLDDQTEIEIGYRIMLAHWGKGYATEAAKAIVRYIITDLNKPEFYGFALHQNTGSLKILEKVGMRYQREFHWKGLPHKLFRILSEEYACQSKF